MTRVLIPYGTSERQTARIAEYLADVIRVPSALFSVSLAAHDHTQAARDEVDGYIKKFVQQTGWRPSKVGLLAYTILLIAFGVGVWTSAAWKRGLHLVGGLLVGIGAVSLLAPFVPMHLRGTGDISSDAPHIALTAVTVLFILAAIGFGASLFGRRFRLYSFATLLTLLVFGAWTGFESTRLASQQPTPWLGVAERTHIGAYLLWVLVLAVTLLRSRIPAITPPQPVPAA